MLEAILAASLAEDRLELKVTLRNTGDQEIIVAARAPFNMEDPGLLYTSGTDDPGTVHLLLGDPVVPEHLNVFQPDTAFYRFVKPGQEVSEEFALPNPFTEGSPYWDEPLPWPPLEAPRPVERLVLTVHYGLPESIRKQLPVEGKEGLWEIWYTDRKHVDVTVEAPEGTLFQKRSDDFSRF